MPPQQRQRQRQQQQQQGCMAPQVHPAAQHLAEVPWVLASPSLQAHRPGWCSSTALACSCTSLVPAYGLIFVHLYPCLYVIPYMLLHFVSLQYDVSWQVATTMPKVTRFAAMCAGWRSYRPHAACRCVLQHSACHGFCADAPCSLNHPPNAAIYVFVLTPDFIGFWGSRRRSGVLGHASAEQQVLW
jgi:hypothetical protein